MFGLLLCCLFGWFFGGSKPDPTQCDIPTNSIELIEQVAVVKDSLTTPNHIADATKKVDPAPSPSDSKPKKEVLVFVSASCPPCERWKRCEMNRFMSAGWSIGIVEQHNYGITPTFLIQDGDRTVEVKGYMTLERLNKELNNDARRN